MRRMSMWERAAGHAWAMSSIVGVPSKSVINSSCKNGKRINKYDYAINIYLILIFFSSARRRVCAYILQLYILCNSQ